MADGPTCHRALRGPSPPVALCSPAGKHPVPCPLPPLPGGQTHAMVLLHFSHVWSLGGVAGARGVGSEDWGLRELGRKAGVPPGGGGQTDASERAHRGGRLFTRTLPAPTRSPRRAGRPGGTGLSVGRAWGVEGGSDPARSLGRGWASAGSTLGAVCPSSGAGWACLRSV